MTLRTDSSTFPTVLRDLHIEALNVSIGETSVSLSGTDTSAMIGVQRPVKGIVLGDHDDTISYRIRIVTPQAQRCSDRTIDETDHIYLTEQELTACTGEFC